MNGIIGRKLGMIQLFAEDGTSTACTVIEAGPCPVVQVRAAETAGMHRVQLGFESLKPKRAPKAEQGHAAKAGLGTTPRVLREFALAGEAPQPGSIVTGARQRTQIRLTVYKVDAERHLLYVKGAIPGPMRGIVTVRKEGT